MTNVKEIQQMHWN